MPKDRKRLMRDALIFFAGLALGCCLADDDLAVAREHRSKYPRVQHGYHYYISTATTPKADRETVANALAFMVASTSSQPIIEYCIPVQVSETLYHIDLRQLRWDYREWIHILKSRYPYYFGDDWPLVVRADWLLVELSDAEQSDTHYRLLYGRRVPRTMADFRKFWKVGEQDKNLFFGMVEGKSGIAKKQTRWIENLPILRGYYWQTKDTLQLDQASDPLDNIDGNFKHDGQEAIAGIPKVSLKTGTRGTLQVYLLAQGNRNAATADQKVDKADGDLVEDYSRFRGKPQVRTAGSCIQCHALGINEPTQNELKEIIRIGVDVFAKGKGLQERLELFHLSDVGKEITRNQEDFADGVKITNGLDPQANGEAFKKAVTNYDKTLTLEDAAREVFATPEELKLALAYASQVGQQRVVRSRLAALAHGKPMRREAWEANWRQAFNALLIWRSKK